MYKRILVAVDGSEVSNRALQESIRLAQDQVAILRVVHAIDAGRAYATPELSNPVSVEQAWIEAGREILATAQALGREAGLTVEGKLIESEALGNGIADAIAEEARTWPADLLVVGTHGRGFLGHVLLGSVAERIVRICTVPVLLVRAGTGSGPSSRESPASTTP
jgi:nucleotide-binding universal stress UspA family protein